MLINKNNRARVTYLAALLLMVLFSPAQATTIARLHFDTVTADAEFIFVGSVVAREARWNSQQTRIHTLVSFAVHEVLKGDANRTTITLSFAGGEIGAVRQQVEAMIYPQLGEHGVYFVESTTRRLVNPLVGWSQGHFKQVEIDGQQRILAANGQALEQIDAPLATRSTKQGDKASNQAASNGLHLGTQITTAVPLPEFVAAIKQRVALPLSE